MEILLLSGGTPYANFRDLAYAWGREKGFHHVLASNVCERRGEVERKRRSDAGKTLTNEQRESFRQKLKRARTNGSSSGVEDEVLVNDDAAAVAVVAPPPAPPVIETLEEDSMNPMNADGQVQV